MPNLVQQNQCHFFGEVALRAASWAQLLAFRHHDNAEIIDCADVADFRNEDQQVERPLINYPLIFKSAVQFGVSRTIRW